MRPINKPFVNVCYKFIQIIVTSKKGKKIYLRSTLANVYYALLASVLLSPLQAVILFNISIIPSGKKSNSYNSLVYFKSLYLVMILNFKKLLRNTMENWRKYLKYCFAFNVLNKCAITFIKKHFCLKKNIED